MPHYTFALRDGGRGIEDDVGVRLPDREQAIEYAQEVAQELMRAREPETRTWRLDVHENYSEAVFKIPFASIDHTLDHLLPDLRRLVVELGERRRSLMEAIEAVRATVAESRALMARLRGKPYLAAYLGERTIRETKPKG
ncbi:MAG TPA: hypothetical protein VKW08_07205 [Xanthobacteraceae bacterium]|nr:hypothetical protein [Xanthobacteraceae bacterium]